MRKSRCKSRLDAQRRDSSQDSSCTDCSSVISISPVVKNCHTGLLDPEPEIYERASAGLFGRGNQQNEISKERTESLSDSLFDLSATLFNKTDFNTDTSGGCAIGVTEKNTSTPVPGKYMRRSTKSPYMLRSPSTSCAVGQRSSSISRGEIYGKKNGEKRMQINTTPECKSPVIQSKRPKLVGFTSACDFQVGGAMSQQDNTLTYERGSDGTVRNESASFFGLPDQVQQIFEETRNISTLFDWQIECLNLKSVQERKSLIYSLPTSGGKTLVAEILLLKEVIVNGKDAIFVFPFVSIVQEKLKGFIPFATEFDFVLDEYAGSRGQIPPKKRSKNTLYLGTIEKIHILINSVIESGSLDRIGLVVIDELHLIGEKDAYSSGSSRGAGLEVMLCKLMRISPKIQIIGMTATLKNVDEVAAFLHADVYTNKFRPVKLKQMVKFSDAVFTVSDGSMSSFEECLFKMERMVSYNYTKEQTFKDPDHVVGLCSEVIPQSSCLVFCPSKKNCENVASLICSFMPPALRTVNKEGREALLAELQSDADGNLCTVLEKCIPYGVAYHHSGLTMDERKAIEDAFLQGVLCLLCCTSTLAAGVNLPARRVIIRSPYVGRDFINPTQYKQMIGRAGRTGFSSEGESILIVNKISDRCKIEKLVREEAEYCRSGLLSRNTNILKSVLLSLVGLNVCKSLNDVQEFLSSTLAARQQDDLKIDLTRLLQDLIDFGLMKIIKDSDKQEHMSTLTITQLGTACYKSSLPLNNVTNIYKDLESASQHLVVDSYVHLLYVCVPDENGLLDVAIDWNHYLNLFGSVDSTIVTCANLFGISERLLISKATGNSKSDVNNLEHTLAKFYCAMMLNDLVLPTNIWDVAKKYNVPRGLVQNLLSSASSFCFHLTQFCKHLSEFWALCELLQVIQKKLNFTFSQELHVLMEIPRVKYGRARQLFNSGYKTLACVANANPQDLIKVLEGSITFTGCKGLIQGAQLVLNEKIDALRDEAEELKVVPADLKID